MKKILFFILLIISELAFAQLDKFHFEKKESAGYQYESVTNDPMDARIYTLENGLKVYMTVYKDEPRIQTYIAVKAGSKNDPSNATGLAHYLEHMLFKGTSKLGTVNWEKESEELDKIEALYEKYRTTLSPVKRKEIYRQIDSVSQVASQYAVPNEYDKLLSNLGATGTNAYTFFEQTVYINNIPSNALQKWAQVESERFSMLASRLFHTELEAVYEEKNKGMDQDNRKIWENLLAGVFPDHPYGTQTTIGTVEHLKNPSISEIKKYFLKYYVPNNMAICMSGDFDPDEAIKTIDAQFSKLRPMDIKPFKAPKANPPSGVRIDTVYGPDAESVNIGFRFHGRKAISGAKSYEDRIDIDDPDVYLLKIISMLLNNGQAGIMDLDLIQKQKVLSASVYDLPMNDYSLFTLSGKPKSEQDLSEVKDLLLAQIDSLKEGHFQEWLLDAVVNDYLISKMREYESNRARADAFVESFISGIPWNVFIMEEEILKSFSKEDVVQFCKANFKDDYQVIYKLNGQDHNIVKVDKPEITPIKLNRDIQSQFYDLIMMEPVKEIQPVFLDYTKDLSLKEVLNVPLVYKRNKENDLFYLYYIWETGKNDNPSLPVAAGFLSYLGTENMPPEKLSTEFYKLGCDFSFSASDENVVFTLSGLNENFDKALNLFENLIKNAKPEQEILNSYTSRIIKARQDNKKSKDIILKSAMLNYAKYGKDNPFKNVVPMEELVKLKGEDLLKLIQDLYSLEHRILYYGPADIKDLSSVLKAKHKVAQKLQPVNAVKPYVFQNVPHDKVYFISYDMVQAEIIMLSKSIQYDKEVVPEATLYNEYFGGGMGSLVFQELRESKALAYTARSSYVSADRKEKFNYNYSYIGTQADKIHEAINGMDALLNGMPESPILFSTSKASVLENIRTNRITKSGVIWSYEKARRLGLSYDIRKDIFEEVGHMHFEKISSFQDKYIKDQPLFYLIIGSGDRINVEDLKRYGKVEVLSLEEIFGY